MHCHSSTRLQSTFYVSLQAAEAQYDLPPGSNVSMMAYVMQVIVYQALSWALCVYNS